MDYKKGSKIVFTSFDEKYIELYTLTGTINKINKDEKTISINIDYPDLIDKKHWNITKENIISNISIDSISSIQVFEKTILEWLNRGHEIINTIDCYSNLLKFLTKTKNILDEYNLAIIFQTIANLNLSFFESEDMIKYQTDILSTVFIENLDSSEEKNESSNIELIQLKIEKFKEFVKLKQKMLN